MTLETAKAVVAAVGGVTPVYVYSQDYIMRQIAILKESF